MSIESMKVNIEELNKKLLEAASKNDVISLQLSLNNGADINFRNTRGWSALTSAASWGSLDVLKILVENGADLELKTKTGHTALTEAARWGHVELGKLLLDSGANVEHRTEAGDTALNWASTWGRMDMLELLLSRGASFEHKTGGGHTALTQAARWGHADVVKKLISQGADIHSKTASGSTALEWASVMVRCKVVKILVEADDTIPNKNEYIKEILDTYQDIRRTKNQLFFKAVNEGKLDIAVILISRGASFNQIRVQTKQKLMHMAIFMSVPHVIRKLLAKGVKLDVMDQEGNTALHVAAKVGEPLVVGILLSIGANKRLKNKFGETPEDVAKNEDVKLEFANYDDIEDGIEKENLFEKDGNSGYSCSGASSLSREYKVERNAIDGWHQSDQNLVFDGGAHEKSKPKYGETFMLPAFARKSDSNLSKLVGEVESTEGCPQHIPAAPPMIVASRSHKPFIPHSRMNMPDPHPLLPNSTNHKGR